MNVDRIENLEEILQPVLNDGKKIVSQNVKRLTAAGENYGSLMLSLDVTVKAATGEEETIRAVAKLLPPSAFLQQVFNSHVTFVNEINFYKTIVPTLQKFQMEQGVREAITFAPKYYGSKLNIDEKTGKTDENVILVLENLKVAGYVMQERTVGFDFYTSKLILKDLANLHSMCLALKILQPKTFEENVRPYLSSLKFEDVDGHEEISKKGTASILRTAEEVLGKGPILERVEKAVDLFNPNHPSRELFATLIHNDCWVNNAMVEYCDNLPVSSKLVDFQIIDYGSPAKDLVFFMFSSIQSDVCDKYYDELLTTYHDTFIHKLKELGCDTTQFSLEALEEEMAWEAKHTQFLHVLHMLFPIFAVKENITELHEFTADSFGQGKPSALYKKKFEFVLRQFAKRQWI